MSDIQCIYGMLKALSVNSVGEWQLISIFEAKRAYLYAIKIIMTVML